VTGIVTEPGEQPVVLGGRLCYNRGGGEEVFTAFARDDSMEPTLRRGDGLLVEDGAEADGGRVAAVMVGGKVVVRRVYRNGSDLILKADNPAYADEVVPQAEVKILGVVTRCWREVG
jgi:SOS-response transcriptional repressor LexA